MVFEKLNQTLVTTEVSFFDCNLYLQQLSINFDFTIVEMIFVSIIWATLWCMVILPLILFISITTFTPFLADLLTFFEGISIHTIYGANLRSDMSISVSWPMKVTNYKLQTHFLGDLITVLLSG